MEKLEISVPEKFKKKYSPNWNKEDDTRKSGDIDLKLWQAEDAAPAAAPPGAWPCIGPSSRPRQASPGRKTFKIANPINMATDTMKSA